MGEFTARLPVARLGLTGLNALTPAEAAMYEADGEFGEVFWHAMCIVFGPTLEEEEEDDDDEQQPGLTHAEWLAGGGGPNNPTLARSGEDDDEDPI